MGCCVWPAMKLLFQKAAGFVCQSVRGEHRVQRVGPLGISTFIKTAF